MDNASARSTRVAITDTIFFSEALSFFYSFSVSILCFIIVISFFFLFFFLLPFFLSLHLLIFFLRIRVFGVGLDLETRTGIASLGVYTTKSLLTTFGFSPSFSWVHDSFDSLCIFLSFLFLFFYFCIPTFFGCYDTFCASLLYS